MYGRASLSHIDGQQEHDLEWNNPFSTDSHDSYALPGSIPDSSAALKTETSLPGNPYQAPDNPYDGMFSSLYSSSNTYNGSDAMFESWDLSSSTDPLHAKAEAMVSYCFPDGTSLASPNDVNNHADLKRILSPDNIKHLLELYKNFQGHWPVIHVPTFNPLQAYDGLLLVMICIGTVYSDRIDHRQGRWLIDLVKRALHRSSRMVNMSNGPENSHQDNFGHTSTDIEEIQALCLLQCLCMWHGTQEQRNNAREEFWKLPNIARHAGFLYQTNQAQSSYSLLHQPGPLPNNQELASWDWNAWVEQEKRIRAIYLIFLLDAAMVIFFNYPPQLELIEFKIPLPADDAAWEARDEKECAEALGLHGQDVQHGRNVTGSRRLKQISMYDAFAFLMKSNADFQPRSTNVYSKFILVHALHIQIWNIQRQLSQGVGMPNFGSFPMNGTTTPMTSDWIGPDGSTGSNNTSGRATPTEPTASQQSNAHQLLKMLQSALIRWKRTWDMDMMLQYPPTQSPRRIGFCRDGVHYFHLADVFLRSNRPLDWQAPPDIRFQQVFRVLKQIRSYLAQEKQRQGLDMGSVGDIDDSYGVEDLTLDMKLLFRPLDDERGSLTPTLPPT